MGSSTRSSRYGRDSWFRRLYTLLSALAARSESTSIRLEEREETLEVILDNLGEGVLATDLDGRPVFANPKARKILGIEGQKRPPEEIPDLFENFDLKEAISSCARERECGERWVRSEEGLFLVKLPHLPKFDNHRGGALIMIRDLSEGRLEANQQRFLTRAAHELKTPITGIIGAAELLLTVGEEDPSARRHFLKHILSEGRRMQRLSDTVLHLARMGAERRKPNLKSAAPGAAAQGAVDRIEPLARGADVEVLLEIRDDSPVRADPEQLEQVLLSLLSNAVKYSESGGKVWLTVNGGRIIVEDEGTGVSPEDLPHVFE